ncbi:MAG: glycosyltransferase family 4 protein [Anaerolineae bacterium]|nr:glycosyltransferase family 4 protein [Phycisphaerae bacterium]
MKILLATLTTQRIGGVETYLSDIIPALIERGHELAMVCELEAEAGRESLLRDRPIELFSLRRATHSQILQRVLDWRPDLVYGHGLNDPVLEADVLALAPSVFFVHNYHGTCISGSKRFAAPVLRPCSKPFGPSCLAYYFPRRCGGLNPITMARMYVQQSRRLRSLRRCDAIVTHSFHMYSEYAKHGIDLSRLHRFVYYSPDQPTLRPRPNGASLPVIDDATARRTSRGITPDGPLQITFTGRVDGNKGIHLLIDAAPIAARVLGRRLEVSIVGDGPMRRRLQSQASRVQARNNQVEFEFAGWVDRQRVGEFLERTDLVVVPSVWPEPFGLVGPEAGHRGIPVAAFAVGGVGSWLVDGVNGYLAPGEPPTAAGLASAIVACLRDSSTYARLQKGAFEMAQRFSRGSHLQELTALFDRVLAERQGRPNCDTIHSTATGESARA